MSIKGQEVERGGGWSWERDQREPSRSSLAVYDFLRLQRKVARLRAAGVYVTIMGGDEAFDRTASPGTHPCRHRKKCGVEHIHT
jgi:hypothetical protein